MPSSLFRLLQVESNAAKAEFFPRFFKTGKGQYGEGDVFLGVTVPAVRRIAKHHMHASFREIEDLLKNKVHEARLLGLIILTLQYEKADEDQKQRIVSFYLKHLPSVNNWDLVDVSAYRILGEHLLTRDRSMLAAFAKTDHLWTQRVAIVSTYAFIRKNQFDDTMKISKLLFTHPHDLIHKAVGWMLREVGKRDANTLRKFLDAHASYMPRTALRYAIEKLSLAERKTFMRR
jgi:3-methyladenine DNA glycosylase AlkD